MQSLNAIEIWSIFLLACTGVGVQMNIGEDGGPYAYAGAAQTGTDPLIAAEAAPGGDVGTISRTSASALSGARALDNAASGAAGTREAHAHVRPPAAHPAKHKTGANSSGRAGAW